MVAVDNSQESACVGPNGEVEKFCSHDSGLGDNEVTQSVKSVYTLSSLRGPRVFVKVDIKGLDAIALADSGADISVILAEFYKRFGN